MKRKLFISVVISLFISCITGFNIQAKADFMTIVDNVYRTSNAINSVNQAGRGIFGTSEFFQRYKERRQKKSRRKNCYRSI